MKKFTLTLLAAAFGLFANAAVSSIDDLAGTYDPSISGWQWFNYTDWQSFTSNHTVTITKVDNTTITIKNLLGYSSTLTGTVDMTAKTITIAPTSGFNSWFTLAGKESATTNITGTFDDNGDITFSALSAWYDGTDYFYDAAVTLSKVVEVTPEWSVKGTLYYYGDDNAKAVVYRTYETTLTKYTGSKKYDYGLKLESGSDPEELLFKVYEDNNDSIGIANGSQYAGYAGSYFYTIYDGNQMVWFDTSEGCSKFEGNETSGQLYLYWFDYVTSTKTSDRGGYFEFLWGEKDAIMAPEATTNDADAKLYDLSGRAVTGMKKAGVYIKNGKKVVVK